MHWSLPRLGLLRSRQRGQGVVEYGLIAASVGLISLVGLNLLSAHEAEYFNALPLTPVAPDAPGALLHPTSTGVVCNTYELPALVQTAIICRATVQDLFSNTADRKPPWGRVTWTLPDGSTDVCVLPTPATGSQTNCAPRTYVTSAANYIPGAYTITAQYDPTSNHFRTASTTNVTVDQPTLFANCLPSGQVELGNPLDCYVTLTSGGNVLQSQKITWQHVGSAAGLGIFTCRTQGTGYDIWTDGTHCPPPDLTGTGSLSCVTDRNGLCGVIYRRLYDTYGGGIGANPVLSLRLDYVNGTSTTVNYNAIQVISPVSPHATDTVAVCSPTSGVAAINPGTLADGNAIFDTSAGIAIDLGTAQFLCSVRVLDTRSNPASVSGGNPDAADAYPPLGSVALTYNGSPVGNCVLQRVATTAAPPPAQAPGQEPFFAACPTSITLSDIPGSSGTLQVSFGGEPGHAPSSLAIAVVFN